MKLKVQIVFIIWVISIQTVFCSEKIPCNTTNFLLKTSERGQGCIINTVISKQEEGLIINQECIDGGKSRKIKIIKDNSTFCRLVNILDFIDFAALPDVIDSDKNSLFYGGNEFYLEYSYKGKLLKKSITFGQYLYFDYNDDKYMRILFLKEFLSNITNLRNNEGLFIKWQEVTTHLTQKK